MLALKDRTLLTPAVRGLVGREIMPNDERTYFEATAAPLARRAALSGTQRCDVCVVGAGFTGLSTALHLAARGYHVVVLEADRIGAGASGRNSGFVLPGYAAETDELCELVGIEKAGILWRLSVEGVALLKEIIARHHIDCDLRSGVLTAASAPADLKTLVHQAKLMRGFGYAHAELLSREEVRAVVDSPHHFGGLLDAGALHLHPLNYVRGLARAALLQGVEIFENSAVTQIERGEHARALTANGSVEATHIVLAANAYLGRLAPEIARRIVPVTALIGATTKLGAETAMQLLRRDVAVYDTQPALDYYRLTADHRLIFGSATRFVRPSRRRSAAWLERQVARVFPQLTEPRMEFVWRGQVDLTLNRLPDLGRRDGLWYAQGFNGHGVALTTLTGRIIADAIAGHDKDFALLAGLPYRSWPGGPDVARLALPLVRGWWQIEHWLRR
jgi:gamma-glutamylputrescine oxidase